MKKSVKKDKFNYRLTISFVLLCGIIFIGINQSD